jgi:hypothetical protein
MRKVDFVVCPEDEAAEKKKKKKEGKNICTAHLVARHFVLVLAPNSTVDGVAHTFCLALLPTTS